MPKRTQLASFEGLIVDRELAEAMVAFLHHIRGEALEPMARLRIALARQDVRKAKPQLLEAMARRRAAAVGPTTPPSQ